MRMKFYVYNEEWGEWGGDPWRPVHVMGKMPVREVARLIASVAAENLAMDARNLPECDLVTERLRDVANRYWKWLGKVDKKRRARCDEWEAQRAKRVNLKYAYAADLLAEHVPLFDGGKLYVQADGTEVIGGRMVETKAVRISDGRTEQWYMCDTEPMRPDGSPPPPKPSKIAPMSEDDARQALLDAEVCHDAFNRLHGRDFQGVAIFRPNGQFHELKQWYSCNVDDDDYAELRKEVVVKEFDSDDENDPAATHVRIPHELFKNAFPKPPQTVVTIGDGRALYNEEVRPFYVLQPVDGEGPELFEATDSHFRPGKVMYEEMNDPEIDDDTEFEWGGSGRYLIKITPELVAWSRNVLAAMRLLSNAAHWDTITYYNDALKRITVPQDVVDHLRHKAHAIRKKQEALPTLPNGKRSSTWHKLELEAIPITQQIQLEYKKTELKETELLEEWYEQLADMLKAGTSAHGQMKQTKLFKPIKKRKHEKEKKEKKKRKPKA